MYTVDLHCDVICKMLLHPVLSLLRPDDRLDVNVQRLREGNVGLQVFALYIPESLAKSPETVFRAAELYASGVLSHPEIQPIRHASDIAHAGDAGKIGAILSLEGADGLLGNLWALHLLHRLGLRLLGPTWNYANWSCDGAMEPRGGGLTLAGRKLVTECGNLGILIDVSHLSERGFWDVADAAVRPFFASHSNVKSLTPHPRNLTDAQIRALIAVDGIIGITFVPWFLTPHEPASIDDVLRNVENVCALGGAGQIAFGSDFDGVDRHVPGLEHPGRYPVLADELLKRYPEDAVLGFMGGNAVRYFTKNLL